MKSEHPNATSSNQALVKVGNNPLFDNANSFAGKRYDELAERFLRATMRRGAKCVDVSTLPTGAENGLL